MPRFALCLAVMAFELLLMPAAVAESDPAQQSLSEIPRFQLAVVPEGPLSATLASGIQNAQAALDSENPQAAVHAIKNALALVPETHSEALYHIAVARSLMGRPVDARLLAEQAVSLAPSDPRINFLLGRVYFQQGHTAKSISHLHAAARSEHLSDAPPEQTAAWAWLGEALAEQGYYRAASEAYGYFDESVLVEHREHRSDPAVAAVIERYPDGLLERRIDLLRRAGLPEQIVAATQDELSLRPDDLDVVRTHMRALLDVGKADEAWDVCERLLNRDEMLMGLLSVSAEAAVAMDRLDEWIENRLASKPELATQRRIADILARLEKYADAAKIYTSVVNADPDDQESAWRAAYCFLQSDDDQQSIGILASSLAGIPKGQSLPGVAFDSWVNFISSDKELIATLGELIAAEESPSWSHLALKGVLAAIGNDRAAAEKAIQEALAAQPECLMLKILVPRVALAQYRWQDALDAIEPVVETHSELAAAFAIRGLAADGLDDRALAESSLDVAVGLAPDEGEYLLNLAQLNERHNDWLAAQRFAQQALELDPANGDALLLAVETYVADRKHELASQVVQKADKSLIPSEAMRRVRVAIDLARRGVGEETKERLLTLHDRYPGDVWIGRQLLNTLYQLGDYATAYELALLQQQRFPDDEKTRQLLIEIAALQLDYVTAIDNLTSLCERYPRRSQLWGRLAELYAADFQVEEERVVWGRLIDIAGEENPGIAARIQRLESYKRFRDWDGSLAELDRWPDSDMIARIKHANRLLILSLAGRHDESVMQAEKALSAVDKEGDVSRGQYRALLVETLRRAKRYDQAIEMLEKYRDEAPESRDWFRRSLDLYLESERFDEAWALFSDYTPRDENESQDFVLWQAEVLRARGQHMRSVALLDQALARRNQRRSTTDNMTIRYEIVRTLLAAKRHDLVVSRCTDWLEATASHKVYRRAFLLQMLSWGYQGLDEMDAYSQTLSEWRALQPNLPEVLNDLGYTWVDAGQNIEEATEMIRLAVARYPLRPAYLDSLGWAAYKAGDYPAAIKYLERAVSLYSEHAVDGGPDPIMTDHLGDAYWRSGDREEAGRQWRLTMELLAKAEKEPIDGFTASVEAKLSAWESGSDVPVADIVSKE